MLKKRVPRPVADHWPILAPFGAIDAKWWPDGPHRGTDFKTPMGTPAHSVDDGVVLQILVNDEVLGNCVMILSEDPEMGQYVHRYSHLLAVDELITKGAKVKRGQLIGPTGKSGHVQGPHLDFALKTWPKWEAIEPIFEGAPC